ncbi:TetR/AcrR family transcriptional regulator C-terminal domain-containing protein [Streptomyces sp. NPDC020965]|uniref:TetR/AcrR family transcriptional regulator C-terminal domain-containing protein n=1 Tax=Streptomyces sp. NPDC020965 TaxID=3365105 RepID=UPI0037AE7186
MPAEEQTYSSVWARPPRRRREQPALSQEQIVAEAIALLDAEGLAALSMRKLGTRLNAGATSMYSHVTNKDELIELVVDQVYGEIEVPAPAGPEGWRTAVTSYAHSARGTILRHPWIASLFGEVGMAYLGPNMMRFSESLLGLFEEAGFELEDADDALSTVFAFIIGMATAEAAWLTTLARNGRDEQEWVEELWPTAEAAAQGYPRLRRLYAAQRNAEARSERRDKFEQGLECVLDGVAARLTRPS